VALTAEAGADDGHADFGAGFSRELEWSICGGGCFFCAGVVWVDGVGAGDGPGGCEAEGGEGARAEEVLAIHEAMF
jgi:hypothetical protein